MIALDGLSAGYGGMPCVRGVTLSLRPGVLTGIVGPNGCGKSTLLKTIAGLLSPLAGGMTLDGRDLARMAPRERARQIAFMPQSRSAPELTVAQLAAHGRYPHLGVRRRLTAQDREAVRKAMERAGAYAHRHALLTELSGGERQRAYLAMLLAQDAPYLLLDEPASSLDPGAQLELMALLRALAREGHAVAVVLHDLPLALSCCDELLAMRGGRLEARLAPDGADTARILGEIFGVRILPAQEPGVYALAPAKAHDTDK